MAGQIFGERSTHERLKEVEAAAGDDGPFDRELWKELADAGLLGIHLSETSGAPGSTSWRPAWSWRRRAARGLRPGGRDHGLRRAAARPLRDRCERKTWLTGGASGEMVLTAAMAELVGEVILPAGPSRPPRRPPRRTARGARAPRPACRRPSWPTPSWCRPPAGPQTGPPLVPASSSSSAPPTVQPDAADDDHRAARGDRGARRRARRC